MNQTTDPHDNPAPIDYETEAPKRHHPDCQCDRCYYGADLATWAFNASEY